MDAPNAPIFIAEISSNHNRDLERSFSLIRAAADAGADSAKFQLFRVDSLFSPQVLERSAEHRARVNWELPTSYLPDLEEACRDVGITFSCSPFYLEAVSELEPFVDFFKVASYELLWDDLLAECAQTGKPLVLSTGMATLDEVRSAVDIVRSNGCDALTLLHCVSAYPASRSETNLAAIETLRSEFVCPSGWSDHTVDPSVVMRAVHRWGATTVEFHLDLDGEGSEYGSGHCWLPSEISAVIRSVRDGLEADGSGIKAPALTEMPEREWRSDPVDGLRPQSHVRELWRLDQA